MLLIGLIIILIEPISVQQFVVKKQCVEKFDVYVLKRGTVFTVGTTNRLKW